MSYTGLTIIAVIAKNGVIGRADRTCSELPWDKTLYLEHEAWLRKRTGAEAVVMGRRTRELYGRIDGCVNVTLSTTLDKRSGSEEDDIVGHDLGWALRGIRERKLRPVILGGSAVFAEALPLATCLELTLINHEYDGNISWPGWKNERDSTFARCASSLPRGWTLVDAEPGQHPDVLFTTLHRQ